MTSSNLWNPIWRSPYIRFNYLLWWSFCAGVNATIFMPILSTNHLGGFWNIFFAIFYENLWYIFWVIKVFNYVTNEWNQRFCVSTSSLMSQLALSCHNYLFLASASKVKVLFASWDSLRVSVTFFPELYTTYIMTLCIECTTVIQPKIVSRLTFF